MAKVNPDLQLGNPPNLLPGASQRSYQEYPALSRWALVDNPLANQQGELLGKAEAAQGKAEAQKQITAAEVSKIQAQNTEETAAATRALGNIQESDIRTQTAAQTSAQNVVNRTTGNIFSLAGDLIKGTAKDLDAIIKDGIDQKVRDAVEGQRDQFTGSLQSLINNPNPNRVSSSTLSSGEGAMNIIPGSVAAPVPASLQAAVDTQGRAMTNTVNAFKNDKLIPTYYDAKIAMIAKDLRAQNPGYKDYVDAKFSQIYGGDPANNQMRDLIQQINTNYRASGDIRKTLLSKALSTEFAGLPHQADAVRDIMTNPDTNKVVANFTSWEASQFKIIADERLAKAQLNLNKDNIEQQKIDGQKDLNKLGVDQAAATFLHINNYRIPFNQIPEAMAKLAKEPPSSEAGQQWIQGVVSMKTEASAAAYESARRTGLIDVYGPTAVKESIDKNMSLAFDPWIQALTDKDYSLAGFVPRMIKSIQEDDQYKGLTNPDTAPLMRTLGTLQKTSPQAVNYLIRSPEFLTLPTKMQALITNQKSQIILGNKTLTDSIKDMHAAGIGIIDQNNPADTNNTAAKNMEKQTYDSMLGTFKLLADPSISDDRKVIAFTKLAGPGNEQLSEQFAEDTWGIDGKLKPGKHTIMWRITQPDIMQAVHELDKSNRGVWNAYKTFYDQNSQVFLRKDVNWLNNTARDSGAKLYFDDKTHRIGIEYPPEINKGVPVAPSTPGTALYPAIPHIDNSSKVYLERQVGLINSAMDTMAAFAKYDKADPNEVIHQKLNDLGLINGTITFPEGGQTLPGTGLGKQSMNEPTVDMAAKSKPQSPIDSEQANAAHVSKEWGNPLSANFASQHLTPIDTPQGSIKVNSKSAQAFEGFLKDLQASGYDIKTIAGYNVRSNKSDIHRLSQHSWGNAIDINEDTNPYTRNTKHWQTDMPKNVGELAAKWGLVWGGNFKHVKDPMHFEFTGKIPNQKNSVELANQ